MIRDRDARDALSTLEVEFENLEATIKDNEKLITELEEKIASLDSDILSYQNKITELEEALAEAYLTQKTDDYSV